MKKFLLATVALVALGATAPALAADLGARPLHQGSAAYAAPIYNWTGFYIGGHLGGAFAGDNSFAGLSATTTAASSAACRAAPTISSRRTGLSVSKPSTAGSAATTTAWCSRAASLVTTNNDALGSITGRARLHLGPGAALRQGRLCLGGQQRHRREPRRRAAGVRHQWQPSRRLHRRRRPRIHVRAELVGQGRIPILQFRQHHLHDRPRWRRSAASATTSIR